MGLGVSKLKPAAPDLLAATPTLGPARSGDPDVRAYDPRSAAISFDLTLRWPTAGGGADASGVRMLQPYLSLGPALLVAEPQYLPLGRAREYSVAVGLKGGAGVSWRLDRSLSLFGEYGFTRAADESWLGGRGGDALDTSGFRGGVEIRF